jgi:hypothetical protein
MARLLRFLLLQTFLSCCLELLLGGYIAGLLLIILRCLFHRIRKAVSCSVSASKRMVSLSTAAAFFALS